MPQFTRTEGKLNNPKLMSRIKNKKKKKRRGEEGTGI